jgi:D,D-heptose 1,7-bisphosphate phosphatase
MGTLDPPKIRPSAKPPAPSGAPPRVRLSPAVFLDKDGTLVEDRPFNVDPARVRFSPGALEGLRRLRSAGFKLAVITNQSGVANGRCTEQDLRRLSHWFHQRLERCGAPLAGFYYCPHFPTGVIPEYSRACRCRKPEPGLILRAARDQGIDLARSWFVGDILNDVEAGRRAGCRTLLVDQGKETEWVLARKRLPHHIVSDFREAVKIILALSKWHRARGAGHKA